MNKSLTLKLHRKHIEHGVVKACTLCPLALMIRDNLPPSIYAPKLEAINQSYTSFDFLFRSRAFILHTPFNAVKFINDFDTGFYDDEEMIKDWEGKEFTWENVPEELYCYFYQHPRHED